MRQIWQLGGGVGVKGSWWAHPWGLASGLRLHSLLISAGVR